MCCFEHDLVNREVEVLVKQRDTEACELSMPLQYIPDFREAVCIPIVDRLDNVNVVEFRPLHRRDCQCLHLLSPAFRHTAERRHPRYMNGPIGIFCQGANVRPRAADAMRERLAARNLGLRDPRSIVQGRNLLFGMFGGKMPLRPAETKAGERPFLVARLGLNRTVLLEAAAGAAGCVKCGSGGRI